MKTTSLEGIELIKRFEGCKTNAYICPAGVLTIGYGHTKTVKPGMKITVAQVEALLKRDLQVFEAIVNSHAIASVNQNQFDALVSFAYNVGSTAFIHSTLLRKLNRQDYQGAAFEFNRWVYAGKKKLLGLERRRAAERALFLTPV
jgi:lysozyme